MAERIVGSRIPDFRQVAVDLVLRYRMRRGGTGPVTAESLRRTAARFAEGMKRIQAPPFVTITPERCGDVEAEWVTVPSETPSEAVVVYFHGGGFVMGSPQGFRSVTWRMARATGRRVLAVGYRKAPDHPFPAWVDDGAAAFEWLVSRGHAPEDILLAGDSAGANLALAVTHRLRRTGKALPGGLVLFSPWADLGCAGDSYRRNAGSDAMFQVKNVRATGAFLTRDCDPRDPEASPIHADLKGFPPMLIFAGARELFLDDARAIARHAAAAGVRADLEVHRNMPHVFPVLAGVLPRAKPAFATIRRFVEETQRSPRSPSEGLQVLDHSA
jgi:monoterpene epsilon-lactone hydrolase